MPPAMWVRASIPPRTTWVYRTAMRLTDRQIKVIREEVARILGPDAEVWLFGSSVDDNARGGDVDLID